MLVPLILVLVLAPFTAIAQTCRITEVDAYEGLDTFCGETGVLKLPAKYRTFKAKGLYQCAGHCLDYSECLTFSFDAKANVSCTLYSKYSEDMAYKFTYRGYAIYDKQCFSRDCDTIDACVSTTNCEDRSYGLSYYQTFYYHRYACGYGVTARPGRFPNRTATFPGTYTACGALIQCYRQLYAEDDETDPKFGKYYTGSADLVYYKPNNEWICNQYNDEKAINYYDYSVEIPGATGHHRFTLANSSVGASFGIYLYFYQYYYSSDS